MRINGFLLVVVQDEDQDMNALADRAMQTATDQGVNINVRWQHYLQSQAPRKMRFMPARALWILAITPLALPLALLMGILHGVQEYLDLWEKAWRIDHA